jgi:hypothetical protein
VGRGPCDDRRPGCWLDLPDQGRVDPQRLGLVTAYISVRTLMVPDDSPPLVHDQEIADRYAVGLRDANGGCRSAY